MQFMTLGAAFEPPPPTKPHEFQSGDRVKVQLDLEIFKMMQEGHGGWNDQMAEVRILRVHVCAKVGLLVQNSRQTVFNTSWNNGK